MVLTGVLIFGGAAALLLKLRRRLLLRALNHDAVIDVAVSAATLVIHWGTFSGVMGATVAGLMTSLATTAAKKIFGFIRGGMYHPGLIRLSHV